MDASAMDARSDRLRVRERRRPEPSLRSLPLIAIATLVSLTMALVASTAQPPVILVGDSVTAGWGASDARHAWPSLLGAPARIDAAPGAPSGAFVGRSWRAETVVVELGINDYVQGVAPDVFGGRMREIVTHISAGRVVLIVPYEVALHGAAPWDAYADQLLALARSDPRVVLVDLRPAFGRVGMDLLTPDLVHPNDRGHAVIANLVAQAIAG
ncbi:MAG: SGNH/GDSL hydrolase family protein [Chloroflexota bacterium]